MDLCAIILTYNEELHIQRCIEKIIPLTDKIFIVDSYSSDNTVSIARKLGATVVQNKWENNYSKQFNWAIENLPFNSEWILRIDADEYFLPETIEEIKTKLDFLDDSISGVVFKRRDYFFNKWIKKGVYPVKLLRIWRKDKGICEKRWMDEHIVLTSGKSIEFQNDFVDHNLNNIHNWINKHNGYSIREAIDLLDIELNILYKESQITCLNDQAKHKRNKKIKYSKLPLFFRSIFYFIYVYIYKMMFVYGKTGFIYSFFGFFWYRTLVDAKIYEIKFHCGNDINKIKIYISKNYGIDCNISL